MKLLTITGVGLLLYAAYVFIHGAAAHLNTVLNLAVR